MVHLQCIMVHLLVQMVQMVHLRDNACRMVHNVLCIWLMHNGALCYDAHMIVMGNMS